METVERGGSARASGEVALVARLRAGEDAAYAELVRDHAGRLLAVARRMLRSEEDARDAVQETFLQAFRGIGRFEGGAQLATWLRRIAVNACLMKLRTRGRKPEASIEDLLPRFYADGHRVDPGPAWRLDGPDPAESREVREHVRECIERLPEIYRSVLLLRDIEQYTTEETAQLLDIKVDAVKVRLHRARQALRTMIAPRYAGEGGS
jgi:RNA polymerase sigma-70 factor (ECF subfamily)